MLYYTETVNPGLLLRPFHIRLVLNNGAPLNSALVERIPCARLCSAHTSKIRNKRMSSDIMKGTKVQTLGVRAVAGVCMVHGWLLGP